MNEENTLKVCRVRIWLSGSLKKAEGIKSSSSIGSNGSRVQLENANEESSGTERRGAMLPCIHERTATHNSARLSAWFHGTASTRWQQCMQQLLRYIAHEYINKIYQSIKRKSGGKRKKLVGYVRNIFECTCHPLIWINTMCEQERRTRSGPENRVWGTERESVQREKRFRWKSIAVHNGFDQQQYGLHCNRPKTNEKKSEKNLCLDFDYKHTHTHITMKYVFGVAKTKQIKYTSIDPYNQSKWSQKTFSF